MANKSIIISSPEIWDNMPKQEKPKVTTLPKKKAGRPTLGDNRRIKCNFYVTPYTKELISKLCERGVSIGRELDMLIFRLANIDQ